MGYKLSAPGLIHETGPLFLASTPEKELTFLLRAPQYSVRRVLQNYPQQ